MEWEEAAGPQFIFDAWKYFTNSLEGSMAQQQSALCHHYAFTTSDTPLYHSTANIAPNRPGHLLG